MIEKLCGEANVDAKDVIIAYLTKQVQELERQLLDASIQIQELTEQDIWCPSNCEKLEKLRCENQKLKEEVKAIGTFIETLEQQVEKQEEVINNFLDIVDKSKMLLNNPDLLDLYLKIKEVSE